MHTTTMKRIAGELGVSITTVSKVLNHHGDISEATRTRVLAKVEELGYQRNAVARSLSLRRTHTLGIVIPDLMHSFFVEVIAGIEPVASQRGYGLLLCSSGEDPHKERAELEMLRGRQVDGVVVASAHGSGNTDMLQHLVKHGTTIVMIDRDDHPSVKCHRVLTDDEQVGSSRRHICSTRAGARSRTSAAADRPRQAPRARLARGAQGARSEGAREWIVRGGFMESDGYRAMKRLLTVRPRIDAVFAANDPAAIGAMKAIWEAGLRVPDDIAIVGVGDIALGDLLRVPLTTVGWSRRDQGRHAAELLLNGLDLEDDPPQRIVIPPRLIVRESSGRPGEAAVAVARRRLAARSCRPAAA
jgi:DNA-binding LacI/PurR family transcriptional regulator